MSKFFCDTNSEIDYRIAEELGIEVIRMGYTVSSDMYFYDLGKNSDNKVFFSRLRGGEIARTQALNATEYVDYIEPYFAKGEDVLYVSFSHEMSGTFGSLKMALDELYAKYPERKLTLVDTRHISMGAGKVVEYAARLHNAGASDEEVAAAVEKFRDKVHTYFTVGDVMHLVRGGRLSHFKGVMASVLQIKPIIHTENGKLVNTEKAQGRRKSIKMLFDKLDPDKVDFSYSVSVMHADCEADAVVLNEMIKAAYPQAKTEIRMIGPVIGAHCGPDTLGLIFVEK
jgi:DegV family protein with EDD domain